MPGVINSVSIKCPNDFVPFPGDLVNSSLAALFERAVRAYPENIAATTEEQQITYSDLNARANTLARLIRDRSGEGKEPVALLLSHNISSVLGVLSVLKTGKPCLPLNVSYPAERIRKILKNSECCLLIVDRENFASAELAVRGEGSAKLINLDEVAFSSGSDNLGIQIDPDDPALVLYTSGSTGEPKGVILTQRNIAVTNVTEINEWFVSPSDRISNFGSISLGLSRSTLYDALFAGAAACLYDVNHAGGIVDWLGEQKITIFRSPQPLFHTVFSEIPAGTVFPELRLVGIGGQFIRTDDVNLFRSSTLSDCVFANLFYSTEAGGIARYYVDHKVSFEGEFMPVGYPWPGKKILLLDEDGQPVAEGERGEITLISRDLSPGYLNQPVLTAKRFQIDPSDPQSRIFRSGDFGRFNRTGALEFLGRDDSFVKVRGYSVELSEIEIACLQLPYVEDAVVLARTSKHESHTKQLVAYVVLKPAAQVSVQEFRVDLAKTLPDYMVPLFIIFLETFPLNINGKVDRRALPDLPERGELRQEDLPLNDVEERLVHIWKKAFRLEKIGVNDNFFELGGDSLLAISLFLYIEREFARQFPSTVLLQCPTIRTLSHLIQADQSQKKSSVMPVKSSGSNPPIFWIPSGFGVDLFVRGMSKYLDNDQPLYLLATPHVSKDEVILIDELAKIYAREIRQFFPQGPYYLVGHSGGGMIACETGPELARLGGKVCWVGVLDGVPPNTPSTTLYQSIRLFLRNIPPLGFSRSLKDLGRNVFVWSSLTILKLGWTRRRILQKKRIPVINMFPIREASYVRSFFVGSQHHPKPYGFDLIIFKAMGVQRYRLDDPVKGWERFTTADIKYLDVPGDHVSIMEEPNISVLTKKICEQVNGSHAADLEKTSVE